MLRRASNHPQVDRNTDQLHLKIGIGLPRRDQPDLVSHVRHDQHFRGLFAPVTSLSQPLGPVEW